MKNPDFCEKSRFLSQNIIFDLKNRNFSEKSKFSSKIESFIKNQNYDEICDFPTLTVSQRHKIDIIFSINIFYCFS